MRDELVDEVADVDPWLDTYQACARVLEAGLCLQENGWGRMQMLPYTAPSGMFWRCEFYPTGRPGKPFYRYSSSQEFLFLDNHCGGTIRKNVSAKALAEAIIKSVPEEVRSQCDGRCSAELSNWQLMLRGRLARRLLPIAFGDYTHDSSRWELFGSSGSARETLEPPPGFVQPGEERPWFETEFWRGALGDAEKLEGEDEFLISLADRSKVDRIAREVAAVLQDQGESAAPSVLRAAIAKLAFR